MVFESFQEITALRGDNISFNDIESYIRLKFPNIDKDFKWFFVKLIITIDFKFKEWKREHRQSQSSSGKGGRPT